MLKKLISVLLCLSALTCGAQSAYDHSKLQMEEVMRQVTLSSRVQLESLNSEK